MEVSRILLDTSMYSAFKQGVPSVVERVRGFDEVHLNTVILGEILGGIRAGSREEPNRAELDDFLASPRVRFDPLTHETAEFYSFIFASLREKGRPIPTNDMWVAACALERGLVVYTRDSHFEAVPGVLVVTD